MAEEVKVTLTIIYLVDNAKLLWKSKYIDIQDGHCIVDIWESLKQELRSQFFPENVKIITRRKLRELRHIDNIWDYVKKFSSLMLDIRDMSEKD